MKKTNRELAEFYGIEVGDTVTVFNEGGDIYGEFLVRDLENYCPLKVIRCEQDDICAMTIDSISTKRYEVTKHKKKVGETKCSDYKHCEGCPLRVFMCGDIYQGVNFYAGVDEMFDVHKYGKNNPIYIALREVLDKEVE